MMTRAKILILFVTVTKQNNLQKTLTFLLYNPQIHRLHLLIIEVGKRLTIAKSLVQHGEWRSWLENNFTLNERTAQRFMQISERFANKDVDGDGFKPSQLTEMLALPDATETEKFIEQKAAEGTPVPDMSVKTLRKEIKKWNAKKTSGTKAKNVDAQPEPQKQSSADEEKLLQPDLQPIPAVSTDSVSLEQESLTKEQPSTEAQEQNKQTVFPTAKKILGITDDDDKAFSLAIKANTTTKSVNISPQKVLDDLFHASNELVTLPDLKEQIIDYAHADSEAFYSDIDDLFKIVDIIREIVNR